ncbi:MAG TPA: proton-conducting transporter membrane subunit, partial [Myxococcota bacterium]|nr:proton-conducting transporter membrane subunit [Myxococcota bacterium]
LLAVSVLILLVSGLAAVVSAVARGARFATAAGVGGAVSGCVVAASSALHVIVTGRTWEAWTVWQTPMGPLHAGIDHLSAVFIILISIVGALAALYGRGYLAGHHSHPSRAERSWCWYNLLLAAMILVVTTRDGFGFLMAWEGMSLASFFLVMYDHERAGVTRAGWIYMVTAHVGAAFLFVMFLLLGHGGTLDFTSIIARSDVASDHVLASGVFILAVIGFGTKAGFIPLHIWLPEAHPAAPSHVSALMSGVMIKTGIYGLLRVLTMIGAPQTWWGWVLVTVGAVSGVVGILFALAQHDLKRLLAYSSIENVGIITMALGLGLIGAASGQMLVASLAFSGALLHVVNHGFFKSLLFMGAGSVIHGARTLQIDRMGGLLKNMPATGALFLVGSAAICGLPPLNGFAGEFLIYSAAFFSIGAGTSIPFSSLTILALALIGGLAVATFTKAFGIAFLGEPRSAESSLASESGSAMTIPMAMLAALCIAVALGAPWLANQIMPAVATFSPAMDNVLLPRAQSGIIMTITLISAGFAVTIGLLAALRHALIRRRDADSAPTWDCGYAGQSSRVQYTGSSFAEPTARMFRPILRTRRNLTAPQGLFPTRAAISTHAADIFLQYVYEPAVAAISRAAALVQALQKGRVHLYLMYIFITIVALMIWNLR